MKTSIITKAAFILLVLALPQSCTDLDTTLYSDLTPDTEYTTTDNLLAALLAAYAPLKNSYGNNGLFEIQELSTETSAAPAKFGPWDDGGIWARLHRHAQLDAHPPLEQARPALLDEAVEADAEAGQPEGDAGLGEPGPGHPRGAGLLVGRHLAARRELGFEPCANLERIVETAWRWAREAPPRAA